MLKRSTHLHPVLFTELIKRFPHLGWHLAADLVEYLETAVNNFRKSQACLMLLQLMSQKTPENSTHIKNIAPSLQTTLNSVMTKAAESNSDVKIKHLREILKLTTKFINELKHTEEVAVLLRADQLREGVTRIQDSALAKKSPDVKGVCHAILSNLSRSSTEEEKNLKNSRRKREANGHIKDETTTKDGETTTKDGGAESSSTEKEVKKKRKKKKIEHL
ncbi:myb-binding protein 1A-like protein [Stylophora pistillata]|uniref:myb-binding protein 1A-like protein n=1 Tax=Stylophora pistillata TaxID=50429 RepID=UPI000C05637A|nr:myb-binding protein 1A-like protein [Stylophora pistillata]